MGIRIDDKEVRAMFEELSDVPEFVMEKTYPYLKSRTPIQSGNARQNTRLEKDKSVIGARYPYADRLNTGWSQQAPQGFTEPSIKEMDSLISDQIRKLGK